MNNKKTLIIAEAGVNHNGNIEMAKKLVDVAVKSRADIIKFQTFTAEHLVISSAKKADYQKDLDNLNETQYQMIKKLELEDNDFIELKNYCDKSYIEFLSTAYDFESLKLLNKLGLNRFKIPSGEINNLPYLRQIGKYGKPIILSTGMSNLLEIERALDIIKKAGTKIKDITVLHCNSEYPTPMENVNLKAMLTIRDKFNVQVGYSDHTLGIEVPIAAVALGASIIEKHFTLDRSLTGPDHSASLEPSELASMVKAIRNMEKAIGSGIKKPSAGEIKNKAIVRKSIVAAKEIKKGEIFTKDNLTVKRPGNGISPLKWDDLIGKHSNKNYKPEDLIE